MRVALAFIVTFAAGVLAGSAVNASATRRAETRRHLISVRMPAELNLTPAQDSATRALFLSYQPRSDSIMLRLLPSVRALSDSLDAQFRALLTPAQRERLDELGGSGPVFVFKRKNPVDSSVRVDTLR